MPSRHWAWRKARVLPRCRGKVKNHAGQEGRHRGGRAALRVGRMDTVARQHPRCLEMKRAGQSECTLLAGRPVWDAAAFFESFRQAGPMEEDRGACVTATSSVEGGRAQMGFKWPSFGGFFHLGREGRSVREGARVFAQSMEEVSKSGPCSWFCGHGAGIWPN